MGVPEADDHWRSLSGGAERDPAHDDQLGHGTVHTLRLEQGTCHRSSGARLMHRTPYTGVMRSQLSLLCKRPDLTSPFPTCPSFSFFFTSYRCMRTLFEQGLCSLRGRPLPRQEVSSSLRPS